MEDNKSLSINLTSSNDKDELVSSASDDKATTSANLNDVIVSNLCSTDNTFKLSSMEVPEAVSDHNFAIKDIAYEKSSSDPKPTSHSDQIFTCHDHSNIKIIEDVSVNPKPEDIVYAAKEILADNVAEGVKESKFQIHIENAMISHSDNGPISNNNTISSLQTLPASIDNTSSHSDSDIENAVLKDFSTEISAASSEKPEVMVSDCLNINDGKESSSMEIQAIVTSDDCTSPTNDQKFKNLDSKDEQIHKLVTSYENQKLIIDSTISNIHIGNELVSSAENTNNLLEIDSLEIMNKAKNANDSKKRELPSEVADEKMDYDQTLNIEESANEFTREKKLPYFNLPNPDLEQYIPETRKGLDNEREKKKLSRALKGLDEYLKTIEKYDNDKLDIADGEFLRKIGMAINFYFRGLPDWYKKLPTGYESTQLLQYNKISTSTVINLDEEEDSLNTDCKLIELIKEVASSAVDGDQNRHQMIFYQKLNHLVKLIFRLRRITSQENLILMQTIMQEIFIHIRNQDYCWNNCLCLWCKNIERRTITALSKFKRKFRMHTKSPPSSKASTSIGFKSATFPSHKEIPGAKRQQLKSYLQQQITKKKARLSKKFKEISRLEEKYRSLEDTSENTDSDSSEARQCMGYKSNPRVQYNPDSIMNPESEKAKKMCHKKKRKVFDSSDETEENYPAIKYSPNKQASPCILMDSENSNDDGELGNQALYHANVAFKEDNNILSLNRCLKGQADVNIEEIPVSFPTSQARNGVVMFGNQVHHEVHCEDENNSEDDYENNSEDDYENNSEDDYENISEDDYENISEDDYENISEDDYENNKADYDVSNIDENYKDVNINDDFDESDNNDSHENSSSSVNFRDVKNRKTYRHIPDIEGNLIDLPLTNRDLFASQEVESICSEKFKSLVKERSESDSSSETAENAKVDDNLDMVEHENDHHEAKRMDLTDNLAVPGPSNYKEFFDDEAELSGEDDGCGDDDDEDDDGNEDELNYIVNDELLTDEDHSLRRFHQKIMDDEDKNYLTEIAKNVLPDGDLNNDGHVRAKTYAWKNTDCNIDVTQSMSESDDEEISVTNEEKIKWQEKYNDLNIEIESIKPSRKFDIIGKSSTRHYKPQQKCKSVKRKSGSFLSRDENDVAKVLKKTKDTEMETGSRARKHFIFNNEDVSTKTDDVQEASYNEGSKSIFDNI